MALTFALFCFGISCNKEGKDQQVYHSNEFNPYSPFFNPNKTTIGFKISGVPYYPRHVTYMWSYNTALKWNKVVLNDKSYAIVCAEIMHEGKDDTPIDFIWLCIPRTDSEIGTEYTITNPYNTVSVEMNGTRRVIQFSSLTYTLENDEKGKSGHWLIKGHFSAEYKEEGINGEETTTLDDGIFILHSNSGTYDASFTYEDWQNMDREDPYLHI